MKILISILAYNDNSIYSKLEQTIRNTWGKNTPENVDLIFYYGDSTNDHLINDKLYLNIKEKYENISHKTLKMYQFVEKSFEFDYIFRTNLSSYVYINELINFIKDKPKNNFFCGVQGYSKKHKIKYISGSGYFLSRNLVKLIVEKSNQWDLNVIDDLALSKLMQQNNIPLINGKRIDINDKKIGNINIKNYHYRCKNVKDRNFDNIIMEKIYKNHEFNHLYNQL